MNQKQKQFAFVLDLDGTALNSKGELSEYTNRVFAQVAGCSELVVASGRALESLPREVREHPHIRYAITSNGAAVHDLKEHRVLERCTMKPEAVEAIIAHTEQENIVYEAFINGHGFAQSEYVASPRDYGVASERGIRYIQTTRKPVADMKTFLKKHAQELDCVDVILRDLFDKPRIRENLQKNVAGIAITASVPRMLEIADEKAGKGKAFLSLIKTLGIEVQDTAAFGNAENDICMMQAAGVGYAVANADPECLSAADAITAANDEDGVAKGILEFLRERM